MSSQVKDMDGVGRLRALADDVIPSESLYGIVQYGTEGRWHAKPSGDPSLADELRDIADMIEDDRRKATGEAHDVAERLRCYSALEFGESNPYWYISKAVYGDVRVRSDREMFERLADLLDGADVKRELSDLLDDAEDSAARADRYVGWIDEIERLAGIDAPCSIDDLDNDPEEQQRRWDEVVRCLKSTMWGEAPEDAHWGLLPDGVEWPRFCGCGLVAIGSEIVNHKGDAAKVARVEFDGDQWALDDDRGMQTWLERGGTALRPPILAADGLPIEAGQTVYCRNHESGLSVTCVADKGAIDSECPMIELSGSNFCIWIEPGQITHTPPDTWERIIWEAVDRGSSAEEHAALSHEEAVAQLVARCKALAKKELE